MDKDEVQRAAKTMESVAAAQAFVGQLDRRGDHPTTRAQTLHESRLRAKLAMAQIEHPECFRDPAPSPADNATAKMEAMSPSPKRRQTKEEIAEMLTSKEVRETFEEHYATKPASSYEVGSGQSGPDAYATHIPLSPKTPATAEEKKQEIIDAFVGQYGPVGGETTPPFGCQEDSVGLDPNAPEVPVDRRETIELSGEAVDALCELGIRALLDEYVPDAVVLTPEELNTLDTMGSVVLTDYPLEAEAQDRAVREYFDRKDPLSLIAEEFGKAKAEALDREIMAQQDKRREQVAKIELDEALNAWTKFAEEGTDECHGDGEVYGRGILSDAQQAELEDWATLPECRQADAVNSPAHYLFGEGDKGIECVDAIQAALTPEEYRGWCKGNAMKYIWRSNHKGTRDQDLQKCAWFSRMASGDDPRE